MDVTSYTLMIKCGNIHEWHGRPPRVCVLWVALDLWNIEVSRSSDEWSVM